MSLIFYPVIMYCIAEITHAISLSLWTDHVQKYRWSTNNNGWKKKCIIVQADPNNKLIKTIYGKMPWTVIRELLYIPASFKPVSVWNVLKILKKI